MFHPSAAHQKAMPSAAREPDHRATGQQLPISQPTNTDRQREAPGHELQPKSRSDNAEGASSHRPKPRQRQKKLVMKGAEEGTTKGNRKAPRKGRAPGKSTLKEAPDRSSNRTQADGVQTNVGHFLVTSSGHAVHSSEYNAA